MRRRHLDDDAVSKLRALGKRYNQPDTELPGHYIRVSPTGVKSYWVAARKPGEKTTPGSLSVLRQCDWQRRERLQRRFSAPSVVQL